MEQTNGHYMAGSIDGRNALPAGYQLINSQNGNNYQIVKTLGGGGFGITYEAIDPMGRRVAVKEFFPLGLTVRGDNYTVYSTGDEAVIQTRLRSFSKEADVLVSLKSIPAVVEIYDVFHANQTAYYVMEYIEGMTLLSFLKQNGLMRPAQTEAEFVKLMYSIDVLHDHGIIHRDISPDNIMVRRDGSFKLIDFGSARSYSGTQNLTINLKENFAPLEQYSESGQGRYTDVYSLAATMYYAYTGKLIPLGQEKQKKESDLTMGLLNAGMSMQQISAMKKALSAKPADRFQSMREFAEAYCPARVNPKPVPIEPSKGPLTEQEEKNQGKKSLQKKMELTIAMLKENPTYPVVAGALFAIALVLQLLL